MKLTEATLESIPVERPKPTREYPQGICLDKGYDYDEVRDLVWEFHYTAHIRARGEEAQKIKQEESYMALLHFVCGLITYRRMEVLG
jgi:putative transposase